MKKDLVQEITINGLLAALYAVFTVAMSPISYGPIQFRVSEILVLFCFFNKRYTIGLTLGCFIANLFSPTMGLDIIFGTIATLIACVGIMFSKYLIVAIWFPVVSNAFIIAWELYILGVSQYWITVLTVGLGELAVMVGGYIIFMMLKENKQLFTTIKANQNIDYKF